MLRKSAISALITASALLLFTLPLLGQGVLSQEYTGLDKYPVQGRPEASSFVGTRAAEFLTIPVGARGIAMGSAFTACGDDITSMWWNPAGLGFLENTELLVNVVDYTLDLTYTYAAGASPILDGKVVVGGFFGYLDIPEIDMGNGISYNAYDFQMGGSMAVNISDRFTAGVNMKYIHQDVLGNISGNAFAIDAGAIYHTDLLDRELKVAFSMQNLGSNITMRGPNLLYKVGPQQLSGEFPTGYSDASTDPKAISKREGRWVYLETHAYRLPTVVKLAFSYNIYSSDKVNWLAACELWRPSNIPLSYATGTELSYNFTPALSAALRMGWQIQTDEFTSNKDMYGYDYLGDDPTMRGLSFGGGITRNFGGNVFQFSYAYRNKGRLTSDNFFTISFGF